MAPGGVLRRHHGGEEPQHAQISQRRIRVSFADGGEIFGHGANLDLRPVCVDKSGGEEHIVYRAMLMDEGEPYTAELCGKRFSLTKEGNTIRMVDRDGA